MPSDPPFAAVGPMPYVDDEYNDPTLRAKVEEAIAEEMKSLPFRKNTLSYLGGVPRMKFQRAPIAETEYKRVAAGVPQEEFDTKRYMVEIDKDRSMEDMQRTIERLQTMLAHQDVRATNAELLVRYGRQAWLAYIEELEKMEAGLQADIETVNGKVHDLNVERTLQQNTTGRQLSELGLKRNQLLEKNRELAQACVALGDEVKALQKREEEKKNSQS